MKQFFLLSIALLCSMASWSHEKRSALEFVENKTQWNDQVLFRAGLPNGGSVYLENDGFTFSFLDPIEFGKLHDLQFATPEEQQAFSVPGHAWKLNLLNSDLAQLEGEKKKSFYHNYFLGQNQSTWSSKVQVFEMVNYSSIYEGIDLKIYSKNENLKYDFILAPGANPNLISFDYSGLESYSVKDGNLVLETSIGQFIESKPFAYQLKEGQLTEVVCLYKLADGVVSYAFPEGYDTSLKLIIDPELIASTLSGTTGFSSNFGHSAAFDIEGNIFTGCVAGGTEYPVTLGAFQQEYGGGGWDIGISKLNPNGSDLLWATYIGGSSSDYPHSLIANNSQELYVYGSTQSTNYPTTTNAYQPNSGGGTDIIVTHLSEDGSSLIGSTYLGGSLTDGNNANGSNYGDNYRGEIIIDYDDNPIITSGSQSVDFPVLANAYQADNAGGQDAVVVKLTPELSSLLVSTYFGSEGSDMGYGLRTLVNGDIVIAGSAGENLPITEGAYQTEYLGETGGGGWGGDILLDGFIAKLNSEGSELINSTYFGTESKDQVFFMDLDFDENIWVYGQAGGDIPVTEGVYINENSGQFVSKFSNDLTELLVSTTIGSGSGNTDFVPDAFLVDNCDNVYISAYNSFGALDITDDALFETGGFYVAVFEEDLADMLFGTFYTGNHVDGGTSRFDKNGVVYQGVCSGGGFNTTEDAWATDQTTGWDIGIFKIDFDASGVNAAVAQNNLFGCAPSEITFDNFSVGEVFEWDFGNGETSTEFEPSIEYEEEGVYDLTLIVTDSLSCNIADTLNLEVTINEEQPLNTLFDIDLINCDELTVQTNNQSDNGAVNYLWDMGDGNNLTGENVTYNYENAGDYEVTLTVVDEFCNQTDSISQPIEVLENVNAQVSNEELNGCIPLEIAFDNTSNGADYLWNFGNGVTSTEFEPSVMYDTEGVYTVSLVSTDPESCNISDTLFLEIVVNPSQILSPLFDASQIDCNNFTVEGINQSIGENVQYSWEMGDGTTLQTEDVTHNYDNTGSYTITLSVLDELCDVVETISEEIIIEQDVEAVINSSELIGCVPLTVDLENFSSEQASIVWNLGDGTPLITENELSYEFSTPGTYTISLLAEDSGNQTCSQTDETTAIVEVLAFPVVDLGNGGRFCLDSLVLNAFNPGTQYIWQDGSTGETLTIYESGVYNVEVDNGFCSTTDDVEIDLATGLSYPESLIPNVFSPNGDQFNETFKLDYDSFLTSSMQIYNRWGKLIYEDDGGYINWDGTIEGTDVSQGVYFYIINIDPKCSQVPASEHSGSVTLMR